MRMFEIVCLVLLVYGIRYLSIAARIRGTGQRFAFSAWDGVLSGHSAGRRTLFIMSVLCFGIPFGLPNATYGIKAWRDHNSECKALVSAERLNEVTGLAWKLQMSGDRRGGTGCYAEWQTAPEFELFSVEADLGELDQESEKHLLETDGLKVGPLGLGEWGFIGESNSDLPPPPPLSKVEKERNAKAVAEMIGQPELGEFFAAVSDTAPDKTKKTSAVIAKCGVRIRFSTHGDNASEHVRPLIESVAPAFDRLCRYASR